MPRLRQLMCVLFCLSVGNGYGVAQNTWKFMEPDEKIFFDPAPTTTLDLSDVYESEDFKIRYGEKSNKLKIDYNQDLNKLSIQDLRLLKFTLLAKNGYIFQDAYLRDYFCGQQWFQPIYWDAPFKLPISQEDLAFYNTIKTKEEEYRKRTANDTLFRYKDICNKHLISEADTVGIKALEQNGFVIKDDSHNDSFWSLYETNKYEDVPSFITTDAFMHAVNLYYRFAMTTIEKDTLIPTLDSLCFAIYSIASTDSKQSHDSSIIKSATFAQFYYGVACKLLGRDTIVCDKKYEQKAEEFYTMALEANTTYEDREIFDDSIPFSLFKPRGNYDTREKMRRYFRAVSWLGLVPFKLKNEQQFKRIQYLASLFKSHEELNMLYARYTKLVAFFVGKGDNPSLADVSKMRFSSREELLNHIRASGRNRINEMGRLGDRDVEVYTLPKSYTPDAEAMTKIVNIVDGPTRREFPRGLDILAGKGIRKAEDILLNYYHENDKWPAYTDSLQHIKTIFAGNDTKNKSAYTYWLAMIAALFERNTQYPLLMKKAAWEYKSLNAGLASYAQLKHNTILYAEQPNGAEGGDGEGEYEMPKPSVRVAYVEPNIAFWESASAFINKLNRISKNKDLKDLSAYLLSISKKELSGEELTAMEYYEINSIGKKIEDIEIRLTTASKDIEKVMKDLEGSYIIFENNNSLLTVADVYTLNSALNSTCLELGVGGVKQIYTIVPINGYNYLCRGGVFSYYEFQHDADNRLTDKEWQTMVEEKRLPELQPWFTPFMVNVQVSEKGYLEERPQSFITK